MKNHRNRGIVLSVLCFVLFGSGLFSDGFIVVPHPKKPIRLPSREFNPFPLEVKYHNVDVNIEDNIAVTSIDQIFYNPTRRRLEGYYLFPVPDGAVIKKFSMFINGKETQAELLDSGKARKIYEDIVRRMKDPALLEYSENRVFKARIFPIEPLSEKRVKISYTEILTKDNSIVEYIYPLNTEKFSSKPLKNVRVKVNINTTVAGIKSVFCPTHEVDIIRKGKDKVVVVYEETNVKPDTDLKLYYGMSSDDIGLNVKSFKIWHKEGYFLLNVSPGFGENLTILPKDICFVLDVSGSMSGEKLKKAKNALKFCVNNLNNGDRFEIIKFSTEAEQLFRGLKNADSTGRKEAIRFIDGLRAIGGTNIEEALTKAISVKNRGKRPYTIIFITDGKPTIGETDEDNLLKIVGRLNTERTRIFTFGIGNDINTHLLDRITKLTKAFRSYISEKEDMEVKISGFFKKIESPVLTDLRLDFSSGIRANRIYPKDLPDLFNGSTLSILGRYEGSGVIKVTVTGKMLNRKKTISTVSRFVKNTLRYDFIPHLWASRRIGFLLDQIRLNGESKEVTDEITQLAKEFGIITPYTSYLIVEDEKKLVRRNEISMKQQVLAPIVADVEGFKDFGREESGSLKEKSGKLSVRASTEAQDLSFAGNIGQTKQGRERLSVVKGDKSKYILDKRMKNIFGRAFYFNGKFWVDSMIHLNKYSGKEKMKFGSVKYFNLLKKTPVVSRYFALGRNVQFVYNKILYEIYDSKEQ